MSSLVVWMITLTLSLSAIVISAAAGKSDVHLAMTSLVSLVFAVLAIRENTALKAQGASQSAIAASTARYMGLVWIWGALGLLMTYFFILVEWKEWWHFFLAFAGVGVLSIFFAATMQRDADAGKDDPTMLSLGRALTWAQIIGMVLTVVGLLIDPDKSLLDTKRPDWAANSIFMFGSLALLAISINSLLVNKPRKA